jgi:hypothetical protein
MFRAALAAVACNTKTYIYVVPSKQPESKYKLEQDSDAHTQQPWYHHTSSGFCYAEHHQYWECYEQQEVEYKYAAPCLHCCNIVYCFVLVNGRTSFWTEGVGPRTITNNDPLHVQSFIPSPTLHIEYNALVYLMGPYDNHHG